MKGTEKQIAWAEDIKKNVNAVIEALYVFCDKVNRPEAEKEAARKVWEDRQERLNSCEYAGYVIDFFECAHFTGDIKKDAEQVGMVYRLGCPDCKYKF